MRAAAGPLLLALALGAGCDVLRFERWHLRQAYGRAGFVVHQLQLPSGRMRVYVGGPRQRRALLLIHGFGFGALETWQRQVRRFARDHQVIAPDLYWFGGSLPRRAVGAETAADQAAAMAELLDHLGVARAHVVGVSFGGFVALELARAQPFKVDRLVLVDAAGLRPTAAEERRVAATFGHPRRISDVLIPGDVATLERFLEAIAYRPRWIPRPVLRQLLAEFQRNAAAKTRILRRLRHGMRAETWLRRVRQPTLVVWGRHDRLLLPSVGQRMHRALPRAKMVWLERSGHMPMLEQPHRFNALVSAFLR